MSTVSHIDADNRAQASRPLQNADNSSCPQGKAGFTTDLFFPACLQHNSLTTPCSTMHQAEAATNSWNHHACRADAHASANPSTLRTRRVAVCATLQSNAGSALLRAAMARSSALCCITIMRPAPIMLNLLGETGPSSTGRS
jgi:hypothetical protein